MFLMQLNHFKMYINRKFIIFNTLNNIIIFDLMYDLNTSKI